MTSYRIHDNRACALGEGPLWHPLRKQLFWFDILGNRMLCDDGRDWQFDVNVSACGWINETEFLIASEIDLFRFDIETGARDSIVALEPDRPDTRSNDGRIDPLGGFWIGTMGKAAEPGKGAIYRYYKGELRRLVAPITIPNAICFSPDGGRAWFTDTVTGQVMRVDLDGSGWPKSDPDVFLDLRAEGLHPDGAIILKDGSFLNAQYHAGRVALYGQDAAFLHAYTFPASQMTCPAMGGSTLFATSAWQEMSDAARAAEPHAGKTFAIDTDLAGQDEHRVVL